jgi:uncharacterized membrane protein (DUF4010 family)
MDLANEFYIQLAYSLCIGLIIGLERSLDVVREQKEKRKRENIYSKKKKDKSSTKIAAIETLGDYMGIRTFIILSLSGFIIGLITDKFHLLAPIGLLCISAIILAMYFKSADLGIGITTEVAAITTFALGILCHYHPKASGVMALVLTIILASKRITHQAILKIRRVELTDTLKFLIIIMIILPLLPNRALDPFKAFNPYKVGFLVVLISGISYVGYFLTRFLGAQKGLGLTGILGGLASSTVVTAALGAEARKHPALAKICGFATVAAHAAMFVRVLVVVALLDWELLPVLAWSVGGMAFTAAIAATILWFLAGKEKALVDGDSNQVKLKNPFSIGPALKFSLFFVFILFVAHFCQKYLGDGGLYLASGLSGLADVDAIILSIAGQANNGLLAREVGANGITIAVVTNSIVKTGIAFYFGGFHFGKLIGLCLGAATIVGLGLILII